MIIRAANRISEVKEYYFSQKLREIGVLNDEGQDIINLGIGNPDMLPHPTIIEKLNQASRHNTANKYQSYKGIGVLREAFSDWYKKYFNVSINANTEVLPLIGSKEGILHISMSFLNKGDQVLVPNPGYPAYSAVSKIVGAEVIKYDLDAENNWLPNLEKLAKHGLSKVKIMWINYPHMPTGANATLAFFEELVAFAKKHKILICNDNPYGFILNDRPISIFQVPGAKSCSLELCSLSKAYNMSGWRVGAIIAQEEYIDTILRFKSNMDSGMYRPIQEAAVVALSLNKEWFEVLNTNYERRREIAWRIMDALSCEYQRDAVGMFVWGRIPDGIESVEDWVDAIIRKASVFITPGFIFGTNGERYIRISLCSDENLLNNALMRIKESL